MAEQEIIYLFLRLITRWSWQRKSIFFPSMNSMTLLSAFFISCPSFDVITYVHYSQKSLPQMIEWIKNLSKIFTHFKIIQKAAQNSALCPLVWPGLLAQEEVHPPCTPMVVPCACQLCEKRSLKARRKAFSERSARIL